LSSLLFVCFFAPTKRWVSCVSWLSERLFSHVGAKENKRQLMAKSLKSCKLWTPQRLQLFRLLTSVKRQRKTKR
jgi:hypothetical protein